MAFCKVCTCGEKIVFERRLSFPDNCPSCGRKLVDFLTYNEDDPRVEELMKGNAASDTSENEGKAISTESDSRKKHYVLRLERNRDPRRGWHSRKDGNRGRRTCRIPIGQQTTLASYAATKCWSFSRRYKHIRYSGGRAANCKKFPG